MVGHAVGATFTWRHLLPLVSVWLRGARPASSLVGPSARRRGRLPPVSTRIFCFEVFISLAIQISYVVIVFWF